MSIGLSSAAICVTDSNMVQYSALGCVVHKFFIRLRVKSIEFFSSSVTHLNAELHLFAMFPSSPGIPLTLMLCWDDSCQSSILKRVV